MSVLSNLSTFSSASMSVNGEEDSETEECGSSLCTTGESQVIIEAAAEGEREGEDAQQGKCGGAAGSNADLAAAVSRLALRAKVLGVGSGSSEVSGSCAEQCTTQCAGDAVDVQLAPQGDDG
jgi:hypothetical protein